jgi:sensor histidine kinase YesM
MFSEINGMSRRPPQEVFPDGPGPGFEEGREGPRGPRGRHNNFDIISIVLFILTIALSIAIVTTRRWRLTEQRATRAETEKANAELSFLKAQINPHFLFNTLNNIYSLAVTNQKNTAPSILKLSNILRYVTDEISEDYVSLTDEVDCMKDYIDLQQLRLGEKTDVVFTVKGDLEYRKIAPLVLMTFIENAFKYGVSNREKSEIRIELWVEKDLIRFFCSNRIFETKGNPERTGIGISNTKQRLEYLYAGKHDLSIDASNGVFTVDLSIRNQIICN